MDINSVFFTRKVLGIVVLSVPLSIPIKLHAQGATALEEVVVTAQRREQSLQEVPISITPIDGVELMKQGYREIEDLKSIAPSVEITGNVHEQQITIRGMGNDTANLSVEQSVPTFVDGIHYGRGAMMKNAFMDVERVEVLNGPQPIHFGQNVVAGAFSLTSKTPTPEWEGDLFTEFGNFGRISLEGGIGGPISDTWGIRLAGQYDHTSGHLTDILSGDKFPVRTDKGGRVTLQWNPTSNFQALFKADYQERESQGDPLAVCHGKGLPNNLDNAATLIPGLVPAWDDLRVHGPLPDCSENGTFENVGKREGLDNPYRPVVGYNNDDGRSGALDIFDAMTEFFNERGIDGVGARFPMNALSLRLNMAYELANGMQIESNGGMIDYLRESFEDNKLSPFLSDPSYRREKFDMWSQELRVRSPAGGMFEWEAGIFYQQEDLDLSPVYTFRATTHRPLRIHDPWGDNKWKSVFGTLTYNFFDNKASIDVGGRFTDVDKESAITSLTADWIMDIDPDSVDSDPNGSIDAIGDGVIWATEYGNFSGPTQNEFGRMRDVTADIYDCGTLPASFRPTIEAEGYDGINVASGSPCEGFGAGYWTHFWRLQDVPDAWNTQAPVAVSQLLVNQNRRPGPFHDYYNEQSFDPQITLRYRPNENHSFYAKWAQAFKAGGFDTSDRGMPSGGIGTPIGQDQFSFDAENAENFELGARGTFLDNRARYGITLFNQKIENLQTESNLIDLAAIAAGDVAAGARVQTNIGAQRNRGVDFTITWLARPGLVLNLAGVVQDGVVLDFINGCTDAEFEFADQNDCWSVEESEQLVGDNSIAGFYDRTGFQAAHTPDWKFIFGLDHEQPVFNQYMASFGSRFEVSDGYTENTFGFTSIVAWRTHYHLNLYAGFGPQDGSWEIAGYARNLLDARQRYNPELDFDGGLQTANMTATAFTTYGIQFNFSYR